MEGGWAGRRYLVAQLMWRGALPHPFRALCDRIRPPPRQNKRIQAFSRSCSLLPPGPQVVRGVLVGTCPSSQAKRPITSRAAGMGSGTSYGPWTWLLAPWGGAGTSGMPISWQL
jgi:hypothetical protein